MKVKYHHELPNFDHRLPPRHPLTGVILGDRSAARSAGTRPGRAGHQTPIREFSIGTFRENSSGTDRERPEDKFARFEQKLSGHFRAQMRLTAMAEKWRSDAEQEECAAEGRE
jgi:hypothetical protein